MVPVVVKHLQQQLATILLQTVQQSSGELFVQELLELLGGRGYITNHLTRYILLEGSPTVLEVESP